jgi:hypothetical protein
MKFSGKLSLLKYIFITRLRTALKYLFRNLIKKLEKLSSGSLSGLELNPQVQVTMTHSETDSHIQNNLSITDLSLDSELNISDYIGETKLTDRTLYQRESTRTRLAIWLAKLFGVTISGTFILLTIAIFRPNNSKLDSGLVKDIATVLITPQVTLLGVALGYYFGQKDD